MKRFVIIALLAIVACTGKQKDPAPVFTSIAGNWKFTAAHASGKFQLSGSGTNWNVNAGYGSFTIVSSLPIVSNQSFESASTLGPIWLVNGSAGVRLDGGSVNAKFTTITIAGYDTNDGTTEHYYTESVTLTRE